MKKTIYYIMTEKENGKHSVKVNGKQLLHDGTVQERNKIWEKSRNRSFIIETLGDDAIGYDQIEIAHGKVETGKWVKVNTELYDWQGNTIEGA